MKYLIIGSTNIVDYIFISKKLNTLLSFNPIIITVGNSPFNLDVGLWCSNNRVSEINYHNNKRLLYDYKNRISSFNSLDEPFISKDVVYFDKMMGDYYDIIFNNEIPLEVVCVYRDLDYDMIKILEKASAKSIQIVVIPYKKIIGD